MRNVPLSLAHAAAMLSLCAACSSNNAVASGCVDAPAPSVVAITADKACRLMSENGLSFGSTDCIALCGAGYEVCSLPDSYVNAYKTLRPSASFTDGGATVDPSACPMLTGPIALSCSAGCF